MRVLIDECLPRQLKGWLASNHDSQTVHEVGWDNVKSGKLLRLANDAGFDVFVTADKNMYYQQSFAGLRICALVIPSNRKLLVQKSVPALLQSLDRVKPGKKVVMELGPDSDAWQSMQLHAIDDHDQITTHVFRLPGNRR